MTNEALEALAVIRCHELGLVGDDFSPFFLGTVAGWEAVAWFEDYAACIPAHELPGDDDQVVVLYAVCDNPLHDEFCVDMFGEHVARADPHMGAASRWFERESQALSWLLGVEQPAWYARTT